MRIILTGAGGFIGRQVSKSLEGKHDVVAIDHQLHGASGIEGDLCDPSLLDKAFANGCEAVIHLATVPGGAAELDPALAKRVNVDATMALIDAAAQAGTTPRFVFASSIAVFGDALPPLVDDNTPLAPVMIYGAHKAMMEGWIETQTRRGAIAGLSLRLPGIVARPAGPSGMKSAFMSNVFHALSARQAIDLPVSPEATLWLMSVQQIAANLIHALGSGAIGTYTLPAIRTSMHDLVHAIACTTESDPAIATYSPDAALEAGFGRLPPLTTKAADALGFVHDGSLDELVAAAIETLA
jgi:nucleoside-diphosphate-sugar epimerase